MRTAGSPPRRIGEGPKRGGAGSGLLVPRRISSRSAVIGAAPGRGLRSPLDEHSARAFDMGGTSDATIVSETRRAPRRFQVTELISRPAARIGPRLQGRTPVVYSSQWR